MNCNECEFFKRYKTARITETKTKPPIPIVVLESLPRNADGSINYEDLEFAMNARRFMEE